MNRRAATPPILVLGMHRSGTALVARALETLGLFVGARLEENYESVFFHRLNLWLVRQAGADWDHPEPVHLLVNHAEARRRAVDYLRFLLDSPRAISYLGLARYLRYRSPRNLDLPWGWKSPLTTYTLPLWLDLFPEARIIHVVRHGVDVAESLLAREQRGPALTPARSGYRRFKALHWLRPKRGGFFFSLRCTSLEGGFSLWEEYVAEARRHVAQLGARAREIRYEDLLGEPRGSLAALADFCGLAPSAEAREQAAALAQPERALAYRRSGELAGFAQRVAERLRAHGYAP
ncbi:MAG: sulfotransferase [Acidobacteria bacterium]|nr:sulfotransferase [Acidobacteriota bacterium]